MKYITFENISGDDRYVIFDTITDHKEMANNLVGLAQALGAGFVWFDDEGAHCYGVSASMQMDSRGEKDSDLINSLNRL
jgi:hypothetical protein